MVVSKTSRGEGSLVLINACARVERALLKCGLDAVKVWRDVVIHSDESTITVKNLASRSDSRERYIKDRLALKMADAYTKNGSFYIECSLTELND